MSANNCLLEPVKNCSELKFFDLGENLAHAVTTRYIVAHSADDGSVQLFAIYDDGQEQQLTNQPDVLSDKRGAAISPDGRYLVYQVVADFFAEAVAKAADLKLGDTMINRFADGESQVEIHESIERKMYNNRNIINSG